MKQNHQPSNKKKSAIVVKYAESMARNPCKHLLIALFLAIALSFVGIIGGNFEVSADNAGWNSRDTKIADRHAQVLMVLIHQDELFRDTDGSVWEDLTTNVQPGWENDDDEADYGRVRSLASRSDVTVPIPLQQGRKTINSKTSKRQAWNFAQIGHRKLQTTDISDECAVEWYGSEQMLGAGTLNAVWRTSEATLSALSPSSIKDICEAETKTIESLQENGLCFGCPNEQCLPPYSLVYVIRTQLENGFSLSCDDLVTAYAQIETDFTDSLAECVEDIKLNYDDASGAWSNHSACPMNIVPVVVDDDFGPDNKIVRYTSSYFPTEQQDIDAMYDIVDTFDRSDGELIAGVYEANDEGFLQLFADAAVGMDMMLAMGSAVITFIAILIHTGSPWLTLMGMAQIILSFPLSYFVYYFIGQIRFFPFLNFIGVFIVFALGADDVFVAVDKWKNARIANPDSTTVEVAGKALPDAASAMMLTTSTTAVAFFATAICPVAPIRCFAIFCGLLIIFDYLMNIFLVFPSLCLYDKWLMAGRTNCCLKFSKCCSNNNNNKQQEDNEEEEDNRKARGSFIHSTLSGYYKLLHMVRWPLLICCGVAVIVSALSASSLSLPDSSDVRVVPQSVQYEKHFAWNKNLLSTSLQSNSGSEAFIIWGVRPADTGDRNNPDSWTTLELDESFDLKSTDAQNYMLDFCGRLFSTDFAKKTSVDYSCAMNAFDDWLKEQAALDNPTETYSSLCVGATSVPVREDSFDQCMIGWSKMVGESSVLAQDGKIKIMLVRAQSIARYDSPYDVLDDEWNKYEDWFNVERRDTAPVGVNQMYHSSEDFWWYDTNGQMLATAITGAAIALACAAVVVFLSSRSLVITMFAVISIGYVLVATSACLVVLGWELGFLESICFAILIGLSCDFVIHFGHAYTHHRGTLSRSDRAKYALISMGPSILAAAATTLAGATIMLFTVITFFQKFAIILFLTIVHSTLGSFVVFIVLADCIGPSYPTRVIDSLVTRFGGNKNNDGTSEEESVDVENET